MANLSGQLTLEVFNHINLQRVALPCAPYKSVVDMGLLFTNKDDSILKLSSGVDHHDVDAHGYYIGYLERQQLDMALTYGWLCSMILPYGLGGKVQHTEDWKTIVAVYPGKSNVSHLLLVRSNGTASAFRKEFGDIQESLRSGVSYDFTNGLNAVVFKTPVNSKAIVTLPDNSSVWFSRYGEIVPKSSRSRETVIESLRNVKEINEW